MTSKPKPKSDPAKEKKALKVIPKRTINQTELLGNLEFHARQALIWDLECPAPEKLVLLSLNQHADSNGECFPGLKRIQKRCGLTRADRVIDRLIAKGLITNYSRFDKEGRMKSNGYQILFKALKNANDKQSIQNDKKSNQDDTVSMGGRHSVVGGGDTVSMGGRHSVVGEDDTVSYELDHSESSKLTNPNELDQLTPEREREEDLTGEVISCEIVPEDDPTRSASPSSKPECSPSCQKDPNEDYFTLATSSASIVPALATQRPMNGLERQLSRKGIAIEDWKRFRAKYFGFVNQVTVFGYGSDENVQFEWAKLVREGWVIDSEFWRGLDLEIDYGMKVYEDSGNAPVPGIVGGARFFKDRRWLQAISRHENNEKFRSVGLEQRVEKSKQSLYQEGVSKMNAAFERLKQKIELKNQELEECHDF